MKFIGQFIQDFIARFRNDVYLESIQDGTVDSDKFLGLDSNNKIVKEAISAGLSITNASDNRVVTSTGGTGLNAESNLTFTSDVLSIGSTASTRPTISLSNTNADENSPLFNFIKLGSSPADNDAIGSITYTSSNDASEGISYADFITTIADASDGDESGKIAIRVAADGNLRNFIDGTGSSLDVVDVNIGYGTGSVTTVSGQTVLTSGASILGNSYLVFFDSDNSNSTRVRSSTASTNRTVFFPDGDGTVQLQGENTGQVVHFNLKDLGSYIFYMFNDDFWYSAGSGTLAILGSSTSPSSISSTNSFYQSRVAAYVAPSACTLKKLCFTFYWSSSVVNAADIDFAFSKFTPISDGTSASITMNSITATDHNGSYTEIKPYYKTFTFSGANASLAAGDAFAFHMRTTGGQSSQRVLVYGTATVYLELD